MQCWRTVWLKGWFGLSLEVVFACVYGMFVREDWRYGGGMTGYRKAFVCGFRDALIYSQWRLREAESPANSCIYTSLSNYSPVAYAALQSVEEGYAVVKPGATLIP